MADISDPVAVLRIIVENFDHPEARQKGLKALTELERRQAVEARLERWLNADRANDFRCRRLNGTWRVALYSFPAERIGSGKHGDLVTAIAKALDVAGADP